MVFKIGITGGIASGKSSCLNYLSQNSKIMTVNLDPLAHTVYDLTSVMNQIKSTFGENCYENGQINRAYLASQAFKTQEDSKKLNQIVGPAILDIMLQSFKKAQDQKFKIIAVEGAVLIEAGRQDMFDQMWVVTLNKDVAFERVKVRNPEMTEEDIKNRLSRQTNDDERLKHAHFSYTSADPFEENKLKIDMQIDKILAKL